MQHHPSQEEARTEQLKENAGARWMKRLAAEKRKQMESTKVQLDTQQAFTSWRSSRCSHQQLAESCRLA
jgi:hypothetical protein